MHSRSKEHFEHGMPIEIILFLQKLRHCVKHTKRVSIMFHPKHLETLNEQKIIYSFYEEKKSWCQ